MTTLQERLRYIAAHSPKTTASFVSKGLLHEAADRIDALESARNDFRELALRAEKLEAENAALLAALEQMRCDAIKEARSKT